MTGVLINIDVDDIEAGAAFYRDALDLKPARRYGDRAIEMLGGPFPLYLLVKRPGSIAFKDGVTRDYRRHWTPVHLDFVVPDIKAALEKACRAGARVENEIRTEIWGHFAVLSDPFGHGFCLIEFIGRGYDEILS